VKKQPARITAAAVALQAAVAVVAVAVVVAVAAAVVVAVAVAEVVRRQAAPEAHPVEEVAVAPALAALEARAAELPAFPPAL